MRRSLEYRTAQVAVTEPELVQEVYCTDLHVYVDGVARIVATALLPTFGSDQPECRIVARLAISTEALRAFVRDFRAQVMKGEQ